MAALGVSGQRDRWASIDAAEEAYASAGNEMGALISRKPALSQEKAVTRPTPTRTEALGVSGQRDRWASIEAAEEAYARRSFSTQ
jgi:hypothetical protein